MVMKRFALFFAVVLCLCACGSKSDVPQLREDNIDEIISAMTLEEKCHLLVGAGQKDVLDSAWQQVLDSCMNIVPGCAGVTYPIPRLGIPSIVMADGPAGLRISPLHEGDSGTYYCTAFPIGTLLASTWNTDLVYRVGEAFGQEVKEYGVDVVLGPGVNIQRNPLCGRNFEYLSEDPLLAGKIAAAEVNGLQSNGIGACIKHFAANNCEINRLYCDSRVDTRTLREIYLKQFEIAVKEAQPYMLMTSYNYINGRYASEDPELTENILRGDWGYKGCVVTDWGAGQDPAAQVIAGNDNIQPGDGWQYEAILKAAQEGRIPPEAIDRNVRRILELIVKTPRFKGYEYSNKPDLQAHYELSREAATEGIVLLKNDAQGDEYDDEPLLPLVSGSSIALFGTGSYKTYAGGRGSGDVHTDHYTELPEAFTAAGYKLNEELDKTYRQWLEKEESRVGEKNRSNPWWIWPEAYRQVPKDIMGTIALFASEEAQAAVITIARVEGEGTDRHVKDDYLLTAEEYEMIDIVSRHFHAVGKQVCVILCVPAPVEMESWKDKVDAIVLAWQTGIEGGGPIVDIVSGKVFPSGRLAQSIPVSYQSVPSQNFPALELNTGKNDSFYRKSSEKLYEVPNVDYINYEEGVFVGYRYYSTYNVPVSYPFGYGLSYCNFKQSLLNAGIRNGNVEVEVAVENISTGTQSGKDVIQVYARSNAADSPALELKAFLKTELLESCDADSTEHKYLLSFPVRELASFNSEQSAWIAPAGDYKLFLCKDACTVIDSVSVQLDKEFRQDVSRSLETAPVFIKQ